MVAKMLANRFKEVLPTIINHSQSTFIKGRNISHNISLAQDLCCHLVSTRNKFIVKLDLKKSFDYINKTSLLHKMTLKGFPSSFVNWIFACMSEAPFPIVFNSEIKGNISSSNELR